MGSKNHNMQISLQPSEGRRIPLAVFGDAVVRANIMLETFESELGVAYDKPGFDLESLHSSNPTVKVSGAENQQKSEVYLSVISAMDSASNDDWSKWPEAVDSVTCVNVVRDFVKTATDIEANAVVNYDGRTETGTISSIETLIRWSEDLRSDSHTVPTLGTVSGQLDSISVHSRNMFSVWRSRDNRRFECEFNDDLFEDARKLLSKTVAVYGLIHEGRTAQSRGRVTKISSIREVVSREPISTLSLYGSIPDLKGNLSDDEYWGIVRGTRKYDDE